MRTAANAWFYKINDICLVLEEQFIVMDISNIPKAFELFGLMGLNMDYPKHLKFTFEVLQKLFLNIGGSSSSHEHCSCFLRNRLLGKE
ncbi:hypothetical protein AALO_G00046340 [Alosa alosa]|uniref:Uncharacterized protein n=1 Tax=Alosa alosa TaxID=278164 RepID=A0AAV6H8V2_9TELE|nr:hypothetical protein AALO_G00046340 [Alosa alosa]